MTREVTSKHIDGIADLVVVAPIKDGFIDAYENVTFETRLRIVSEALHGLRVAAREFEPDTPFSDVTERIMTLLNFRITIHDDDLLQIDPRTEFKLKPRRYLYLAATFDGALEPYMRLIWRPLGIFLDLLFCNCEAYKPAGDHGFPDYFNWVKRSQRESAIFYSTTGLTVRDQIYLRTLERMQRELDPAGADLALCRMTMPDREAEAAADRGGANEPKAHRLALEALNVLYRLADYYPPDRLDPTQKDGYDPRPGPSEVPNYTYAEGRYLLRAARSLLLGWDTRRLPLELRALYKDQLDWFESRADLESQEESNPDPRFDDREVQSGILTSPGTMGRLVRHGALLLMTVTDPVLARKFIADLPISYEGGPPPGSGLYHTIAFTAHGLNRLGLYESKRLRFPKEFREGMERRSGLLGDFRENHTRNWNLPARNWPEAAQESATPRPPIDTSEIDFIIQLRYAARIGDVSDTPVRDEIVRLAELAEDSGVVLAGYEPMVSIYEDPKPGGGPPGDISGHFKLRDGISQPIPRPGLGEFDIRGRDDVRLGEVLCGYRNDRGDQAPRVGEIINSMQLNGSFLVVRKLRQEVGAYFQYLESESRRIAEAHGIEFGPDDLAARLWGRRPDGTPLVPHKPGSLNEFDYVGDAQGDSCPHASHVRRTNPRDCFLGRPAPRIVRRGMSYDAHGADPSRGVMFMAYCASIAEQFEVIQRWVNGANSTGIGAANNDPLVGIPPVKGDSVHRFVVDGKVIRTVVPRKLIHLQWGLYLFAPSKSAIKEICGFQGDVRDIDEPRESRGKRMIAMLHALPEGMQRLEWKRVLEDFDSKDPAERNRAPDIWSAIRWYEGGSYRLPFGQEFAASIRGTDAPDSLPDPGKAPSIVLVASRAHVSEVLGDPDTFSVEIQGNRMHRTSGDSYVAMQPGERYDRESIETNRIMFEKSSEWGFQTAYAKAKAVLGHAIRIAEGVGRDSFKLELRRDFIMPTLALMCSDWFGLPGDETIMEKGAWSWDKGDRKARCPGDFLSPSRHAFYPESSAAVEAYARDHGLRIRAAGEALVKRYRETQEMPGSLSREIAEAIDGIDDLDEAARSDLIARNIIGMMIGFLPPADGTLRAILYEWLTERRLWRYQAALRRCSNDRPADHDSAIAALRSPIFRAMGKRPVPDLLLRVATRDHQFNAEPPDPMDKPKGSAEGEPPTPPQIVQVCKGDVVIVSLASATQRALRAPDLPDGDPSFVFGGRRVAPRQPPGASLHACPAYQMMIGSITGILAALLEAGQIKAMPSSLIVEISKWKAPPPTP